MFIKVQQKIFIELLENFLPKKRRNDGFKYKASISRKFKKNTNNQDVYITCIDNELILSTENLKILCPVVDADWLGHVHFKFEYLSAFRKFPPAGDEILISYENEKFKIGTTLIKCYFSDTPEFDAVEIISLNK